MKGVIIYYSNTGNTKIICEYIQKKVTKLQLELFDILKDDISSLAEYDVAGFAFFTDAMKPSKIFLDYVRKLKDTKGKHAFSVNTYGLMSGKAAKIMYNTLKKADMIVIGSHSLHTPENNAPMILGGNASEKSPDDKERAAFENFIAELNAQIDNIINHNPVKSSKPKIGLMNSLIPAGIDFTKFISGEVKMQVDKSKCKKCGVCAQVCPVKTISMKEEVTIDNTNCQKCWSCYNHCFSQAIYTGKYKGEGQYPKPISEFAEKWK